MRRFALAAALALAAAACIGGASSERTSGSAITDGGTLRVALPFDPTQQLDPQKEYAAQTWELFRCCLLRTLLSYNGRPADQGGALPQADLATGLPVVSSDGLTWTFHLKSGIHYAPPFQDTEITAGDFVRAIERSLRVRVVGRNAPGTYGTTAFYYSHVIVGAKEYADRQTQSIAGLQTPDDHTLVVHLTQPTGDLDYRFAMPTTAPIPPSPSNPDAPLGAATGHADNYGLFLVGSGPYMVEGSGALDFTRPPSAQQPVAGYVPGRSLVFVRDPAWDPETDDLRKANADRMEFTIPEAPATRAEWLHSIAMLANDVDTGTADLGEAFSASGPQRAQLDRYLSDPILRGRVHSEAGGTVFYLAMNLAVPPFDDVHVRRAANLVMNKAALQSQLESIGGPLFPAWTDDVATHIAPAGIEGNLLSSSGPYATPRSGGDVDRARAEMAMSRYDRDGDGVCDATVCRNLSAAGLACGGVQLASKYPEGAVVRRDLSRIGILFDADPARCPSTPPTPALDPEAHVPITSDQWGQDFPDAAQFLQQLFSFRGVGTSSADLPTAYFTMVGAHPAELRKWGYRSTDVPSVELRIRRCAALRLEPRIECWVRLDQFMMNVIVPWVPYMVSVNTWITSARVASFSIDQAFGEPAFDRIALEPGSS